MDQECTKYTIIKKYKFMKETASPSHVEKRPEEETCETKELDTHWKVLFHGSHCLVVL